MNQNYRQSDLPEFVQQQIDAANDRAESFKSKYRFTCFVTSTFATFALLIGMLLGAVGHMVHTKLTTYERSESNDQQEIRIVVSRPVVETVPARDCFDGVTRRSLFGYEACYGGRWTRYAYQPPAAMALPLSNTNHRPGGANAQRINAQLRVLDARLRRIEATGY